MKLFGNKKGAKHVKPPVPVEPEEIREPVIPTVVPAQEPQVSAAPIPEDEIPVISVFEPILDLPEKEPIAAVEDDEVPVIDVFSPEPVLPVQETEEPAPEKDMISSIAEAMGVPAEELHIEVPVVGQSTAEVQAEPVAAKSTKEDKKAAKQAEKAERKAAKLAEKQAKKEAKKWSTGTKVLVSLMLVFTILLSCCAGFVVSRLWVSQKSMGIYSPDFVEPMPIDDNFDDLTHDESADGKDAQAVDSDRKSGCYTFMVAGRDVQSGCTDVIIVGRMDTVNDTLYMVSLPRDTLINKGLLKINTAYQGDKASGGNGIDGLLKEVQKIVGFPIDSWAVVDTSAVEKLIDAIGGVYFDVPIDMVYKDKHQNLDINIKKGYQLLNGEDTVKVLRFRKGYPNGDLGRIETQHNLILALAKQVLNVKNIPNLGEAINIYQECVHSNLSAGNLVFYAKEFLKLNPDNIQFVDMPQCKGGLVNGHSFIFINPAKWLTVINNYLNPYKEDITAKNLSIKTSYDGGKTFAYTAGANSW